MIGALWLRWCNQSSDSALSRYIITELEKTSRSIEKCFTRLGQNFENPTESRAAVRAYLDKRRDSDVFGIEQLAEMIENNQAATAMVDAADKVDWAPEEAREM